MDKKIDEIIVKIWDMAQANLKQDNPPVVRQATLEWARDEFHQLLDKTRPWRDGEMMLRRSLLKRKTPPENNRLRRR